jgi:hypothetical protein
MKNKKEIANKSVQTIETTIGDLVEAITEIALELGKSETEGYQLASLTIERILNNENDKQETPSVIN